MSDTSNGMLQPGRLARIVRRRWLWPTGAMLGLGLLATAYGLLSEPVFQSEGVIAVNPGTVFDPWDEDYATEAPVEPEREARMVESTDLLVQVAAPATADDPHGAGLQIRVDDLDRYPGGARWTSFRVDPGDAPRLRARLADPSGKVAPRDFELRFVAADRVQIDGAGAADGEQVLSADGRIDVDGLGLRIEPDGSDLTGARFRVRTDSLSGALRELRKHVSVTPSGKEVALLRIRLRDSDPHRAAESLARLIEGYSAARGVASRARAGGSVLGLEEELERAGRQVVAVENRVADYLAENGGIYVEILRPGELGGPQPYHPLVAEIASLSGEIARLHAAGEDGQAGILSTRRDDLLEEAARVATVQPVLAQLSVRAAAEREHYAKVVEQLAAARLAAASSNGGLTVLQSPRVPERTHSPPVLVLTLAGLLAGAFVGVAVLLLGESARRRLWVPEELADAVGAPVLAHVRAVRDVEALPTVLAGALDAEGPRVIGALAIDDTARRGDLAFALASSFVARGRSAVVIDADFHSPGPWSVRGLRNAPGLAELLRGEATAAEALQTADGSDVVCLTAGSATGHDEHALHGAAFRALLDELRGRFDRIVLRVPSLERDVSASLAPLFDEIALVAAAGSTRAQAAQTRAEQMRRAGTAVAGAVLVDA